MSTSRFITFVLTLLLSACATKGTIAQLKEVKVDLKDEKLEGSLAQAIQSYQLHLDRMPESDMTPEAILRLADIKIKKEYDFTAPVPAGDGDTKSAVNRGGPGDEPHSAGTQEAIALYQRVLNNFPDYEHNDHALYQLARIYEELGKVDDAINMMDRLAKDYPRSRYSEEIQFRRGEYHYARKSFPDAQEAYRAVVDIGAGSPYYGFALNKLGWTYYKQERYEEGLQQFTALLDHKIAAGNDLDHPKDPIDEKRIEDTYRVMSLSFSYLGGADAVAGYFKKYGKRSYEVSVYKNLGDYYLEKRRYSDAAATYQAFAKSNPEHKTAPYFEMWAIDSYRKGGFPRLVIESSKEFIHDYGLKSAYWKRFDLADFNEVSEYVKAGMKELINYYHAQYQDALLEKNKDENFQEAVKWYREFFNSFPKDGDALAVHYQFAELLLEHKWYGQAAVEFEHIAYDYPAHEKTADAAYAAIYALRKNLAIVAQGDGDRVRRDIIRSSLKFAETFPRNEKAPLVMGAVLEDIYGMKEYSLAAVTAKKMIARYAGAERTMRRAAWLIFSHASFELGNFKDAEEGYGVVLGLTAENDPSRADLIENLAASFYKQGEKASKQGDYKTAATYFLLVGAEAPTSKIRPVADFDGIAALIQSKNLPAAVDALRMFRINYPWQPQSLELSKKLALAYKEAGELTLAAAEYERLATETGDEVFQRASLELAAELYSQAKELDKVYPIYRRYVDMFPKPLEDALEMRTKIAAILKSRSGMKDYVNELKQIMEADVGGGAERTDRTRYLGAKAALELAEFTIKPYTQIKLESPYAENLRKKQAAMMVAKEQLEKLLDYETDVVTSAATYYLAEMYYDFSKALMKSERPYGMTGQEKEQYELALEEQAYPFEEKAIQVHQKNLDMMTRGIYNSWIERSIEKLAKIVPARYAKFEESSGYIKAFNPTVPGLAPVRELSPAQKEEIEAEFLQALQALKLVQYPKAIKLLSKIIAQSPNNPVPYVNLALVYEKMQNFTLAEENLKQAIKIDPENPVAHNEYALLYRKNGKFAEARQLYEKILGKLPNFTMAHKNLGILCDLYMKDYACALEHYVTYSGFMPEDGAVKIWIADLQKR